MLFVEGKWFYNHVLNLHKNVSLARINTTDIKQVERLDKDKKQDQSGLEVSLCGAEAGYCVQDDI